MRYQLDIETLSTKKNAVVLSIGMCNVNGIGDQVYVPMTPQLQVGRCISADTMAWWNEPERMDYYLLLRYECLAAQERGDTIADMHGFITTFLKRNDDDEPREIYMNSPAFDGVVLETLFDKFGLDVPWHYRDPRCFRTLKNLALQKQPDLQLPEPPANLHDALVDCQWQATQTDRYLTALGL